MGITSLQVCMDSSDWLHQGTISEENNNNITGMESSAISPIMSDEEEDNNILTTCTSSRLPLIHERRSSIIRPQNQTALNCPRCDSTHTKFCYYNNYSLSQPRYFCKTCRRYWTKGGTLRNIPVGGGCRKNKKPTSKKSSNDHNHHPNNNYNNHHHQQSPPTPPSSSFPSHQQNLYCGTTSTGMLSPMLTNFGNDDSTELQLAFPDQFQYFSSGIFNTINPNLNHHGNFLLENPITPIDFLDNKYETLVGGGSGSGSGSNHDFMGNNNLGDNINLGGGLLLHSNNFHGINCSSSTAGTILESCQRLMQLPYHDEINNQELLMDVKPNPSKILSLDWHDSQQQQQQQACNSDAGISYLGGIGSWTGLINGYGTSNPLV